MNVERDRLKAHLERLCVCPRPAMSEELETARKYVEQHLSAAGWKSERQPFQATNDLGDQLEGVNIVARLSDSWDESRPTFVVGAHLDSRPNTPGADDNASAVAALLEIARVIPDMVSANQFQLNLELVAFDLEEDGMLGGAYHAMTARQENRNLIGMVSLEMLGYCDHSPNSQQLPRQLIGLYPDTGNFIAVIGNQNSSSLISAFQSGMKQVEELPVEVLQVPENGNLLQATRLSDHSPFWDEGFAALMITDTSFMRNPHYHESSDTPETLDMQFLHLVSEGSLLAVEQIVTTGLSISS